MLSADQDKIELHPTLKSILLWKEFKQKFFWASKVLFKNSEDTENLTEDWYNGFVSIIKWTNINFKQFESIGALLWAWVLGSLFEEIKECDALDVLTTTFTPHLYKSRIQSILTGDHEDSSIKKYWNIWKYTVYEVADKSTIAYVVSLEEQIVRSFHFFKENCELSYHVDKSSIFNILISNKDGNTEIWHWSFEHDFEMKYIVNWTNYSDIDIFVADNTIIQHKDWIIELINISTWECIFRELDTTIWREDIIEVTQWPNQTVVVVMKNGKSEKRYFISDEESVWEYKFWTITEPNLFQYNGWCITIQYSQENDEYFLMDIGNQKIFKGIKCFKDSKWNIYHSWDIFLWDAPSWHIWLQFSIMNEDYQEEKVFYSTDPLFELQDTWEITDDDNFNPITIQETH